MSARMWRIGGVAAAVLLVVAAWFALVSPTLQKAEALQLEAASQQAASDQLRSRISLLKKQSEELPAQEAKLAGIQQRMPGTPALPMDIIYDRAYRGGLSFERENGLEARLTWHSIEHLMDNYSLRPLTTGMRMAAPTTSEVMRAAMTCSCWSAWPSLMTLT